MQTNSTIAGALQLSSLSLAHLRSLPKFDVNPHCAARHDVVRLLGFDQARLTGLQQMNATAHVVLERAGFDHDAGPRAGLGAVIGLQRGWQCLFAERRRAFVFASARRHRQLVAQRAVDGRAQLLPPTLFSHDPRP